MKTTVGDINIVFFMSLFFFHLTIKIVFDRLFFQERVIAAKVSIYCVVSSLYLCFFLQKK